MGDFLERPAPEQLATVAPWQSAAGAEPRTDLHGAPLPDGAIARFGTIRFRLGGNPFYTRLSADGL